MLLWLINCACSESTTLIRKPLCCPSARKEVQPRSSLHAATSGTQPTVPFPQLANPCNSEADPSLKVVSCPVEFTLTRKILVFRARELFVARVRI